MWCYGSCVDELVSATTFSNPKFHFKLLQFLKMWLELLSIDSNKQIDGLVRLKNERGNKRSQTEKAWAQSIPESCSETSVNAESLNGLQGFLTLITLCAC